MEGYRMDKRKKVLSTNHGEFLENDFPITLTRETMHQECTLYTGMHWHNSLELIYVVSGSISVTCGTKHISASVGDLVIIRPGEAHYVLPAVKSAECCNISAEPGFFQEAGLHLEYSQLPIFVPSNENPQPSQLVQQLILEMENCRAGYDAMVRTLMIQLLVCLMRSCGNTDPEAQHDSRKIRMIKEALNYIEQNYASEITVDDICSHIGFSKYYFCRTFKEITGKTAVEHLNIIRCQRAYDLIAIEKYNVKQAAELSGFHNQQYFCKVYKKYAGCLPSHVKRQQAAG